MPSQHHLRWINGLRLIALFAYSCILLNGMIISLPLIMWLCFSILTPNGNSIAAFAGLLGIALHGFSIRNKVWVLLLSLGLLLTPLINQLLQAPIEVFNYVGFWAPLGLFLVSYATLLTIALENAPFQKNKTELK